MKVVAEANSPSSRLPARVASAEEIVLARGEASPAGRVHDDPPVARRTFGARQRRPSAGAASLQALAQDGLDAWSS